MLNSDFLNEQSTSSLQMQIFPNPSSRSFSVKLVLKNAERASIEICSIDGKLIEKTDLGKLSEGEHILYPNSANYLKSGIYLVSIISAEKRISQQFVVK